MSLRVGASAALTSRSPPASVGIAYVSQRGRRSGVRPPAWRSMDGHLISGGVTCVSIRERAARAVQFGTHSLDS